MDYTNPRGERKRIYDPLNRIKDLDKRYEAAIELINRIAASNGDAAGGVLMTMLDRIKHSYRTKTLSNRKSHVKKFLTWLNGRPDATVTPEMAFDYIHYLSSTGLKAETIRSNRRSMHRLYGLIDKNNNPFNDAPITKGESKSLLYFNDKQIDDLAVAISKGVDQRLWLAVHLHYYCFIRGEEMRFLEVFNVPPGYRYPVPEVHPG